VYERHPETMRAPPEGKSRVVTVDDEVLAESGAVMESLLDRFDDGTLPAQGSAALTHYRYWLPTRRGRLCRPSWFASSCARFDKHRCRF
jgi:glutathione S-transferase